MRGIALSKLTGYMIDREPLRSEACMKARMKGRGKIPHDPVPYTIQAYTYDKKMVPEYVSRAHMATVVPDSKVKPIIDDLLKLRPTRDV